MNITGVRRVTPIRSLLVATIVLATLASCAPRPERIETPKDSPFPPGVDPNGETVDGVEVGNRLISAGQYELALDAFTRAALEQGMTPEILSGFGSANLGLGRLGQAEELLRQSVKEAPDWPEAWNNLGVVLMEKGETAEAEQVFRKAYALDNGQSDSIRDNLRLALAKTEITGHTDAQNKDYKLVQRGEGDFLLSKNQN